MSTKQLQARMITTKSKITYNNTRTDTIYRNILSMDYDLNRHMILSYKYACYMRYYTILMQGNVNPNVRMQLSQLISSIVSSFSQDEYNAAFQIEPKPSPVVEILQDSGHTFYISHRITSARTYFIFRNIPNEFLFKLNTFYTFDLSDPSNLNTKLSFSEDGVTGKPYRGVSYISTPGTPGAKLILSVYKDIRTTKLNTFNDMPMYTPLKYFWGYSTPVLLIKLLNVPEAKDMINTFIDARQYSYLSVYELLGPKYGISDSIEPTVFRGSITNLYNFTYGTYYLEIPKMFPATLLNKGYEDYVIFIGDEDKKVIEPVYGIKFAPGNLTEGDYAFYYGRVQMTIYKPFPFNMSIYSKSYGFMGGSGLFRFIDSPIKPITSNVIDLSRLKPNTLRLNTVIRFNNDMTTLSTRKYGLTIGVYTFLIPDNIQVAFLNKDKEDVFVVTPGQLTITTGPFLANDGNSYSFYGGSITVYIKGYFDTLSLCTTDGASVGYSGGYKLLVYNAYTGVQLPYVYKTNPVNQIKGLCAQTTMSILSNRIHFNEDYESSQYGMYNGIYMIFNIPQECPITLLNRGKSDLVVLESLQANSTLQGTGPDGEIYTFYYGILKITVHGNFGFMSLYTLFNNYMGGFRMFTYNSAYDMSDSYPDPRSIPLITAVAPNTSFTEYIGEDVDYQPLNQFTADISIPYDSIYTYTLVYNDITLIDQKISILGIEPRNSLKYTLQKGIYLFRCSYYVTVLNYGKERDISMFSMLSQSGVASDGKPYTFYKGDLIALYVYGNFVSVSLEIVGQAFSPYLFVHDANLNLILS